jgi:molybdenum cofactor cytidylyltransferase
LKELGAVILAAGYSSRLGRFKPLVNLGGMSLLARVVELFSHAGVGQILVICGHRGQEVAKEARALGAEPVINPGFEEGMFSSVKAGLARLDKSRAAWVVPVDIPLVRPGTLNIMHETWSKSQPPLIHPTFEGAIGHPPLLDRGIWQSVLQYTGEQGLKGALEPWRKNSLQVASGDRNTLLDLDTLEDLTSLERRATRLGVPDREESDELAREVLALSPDLLEHGQEVARIALNLARALPGNRLDMDLIYAAGLLHDLAKGSPRHQEVGAARLFELGLDPVARAMAKHGDMPPPEGGHLGEAELVCLADKCVQGGNRVNPHQRYHTKLELYQSDPRALEAINRRWENCRGLMALWEKGSGQGLESFLALGPDDA